MEALVKPLWEKTHVQEVVNSNPSAGYWMDIFQINLLKKKFLFEKTNRKYTKKSPGMAHF